MRALGRLALVVLLGACTAPEAAEGLATADAAVQSPAGVLQTTRLGSELLARILVESERVDLNALPAGDQQQLLARLYRVPLEGPCVEGHMVCSFEYYLAVSEYGEGASQATFSLGEVGEVVDPTWLARTEPHRGRLQVTVLNYPEYLLESSPELKRKEQVVVLDIGADSLVILPQH